MIVFIINTHLKEGWQTTSRLSAIGTKTRSFHAGRGIVRNVSIVKRRYERETRARD